MCLDVDHEKTKLLRESGVKTVTRYKLVRSLGKTRSIYHFYEWAAGWNVARGEESEFFGVRYTVHVGIHVYVNKKDVELVFLKTTHDLPTASLRIMEVKCDIADLLGVGTYDDYYGRFESEAYNKVYVDELPSL